MADGYFERGEIYSVRLDDGFGSEEGAFRPGVIVSSNVGNKTNPNVIMAYLTTQPRELSHVFDTMATGRRSWILTDQLAAVSKGRLKRRMGTLNDEEMRKLDECLEIVLDLGYVDDKKIEALEAEKAGLQTDIKILEAQIAAKDEAKKDELLSLRMESEMWQKLYLKAMDQIVAMKFGTDVAIRTERKVEPTPKVEESPKVVEPESPKVVESEQPEPKVDINHCTQTALKKLGFSLPMARLIVSHRPFKDVPDLKRVPGMKANFYRIVEGRVCCTPVEVVPEKPVIVRDAPDPGYEVVRVNINTATPKEIAEATGMRYEDASCITGYRNKNGPYTSVDQVANVNRFTAKKLDRYRDMLEV